MAARPGRARTWAGRLHGDRYLLGTVVVVLLVAGLSALVNLPRIEDPRITRRNAIITTTLPGASAARVEALVTEPIEAELATIAEIRHRESTSRPGVSTIGVELAANVTDATNEAVFARIRDRLGDVAPSLPEAASTPDLDDTVAAVADTLIAVVRWEGDGPAPMGRLSRTAEDLADALRRVGGTELARTRGTVEEAYTVTVEPAETAALGLPVARIAERIAAADSKGPAGLLRHPEHRLPIEMGGELDSLERLAGATLMPAADGGVVRVGDVATIEKGWREPVAELAYADGRRAVFVTARMAAAQRVDHWATDARAVVAEFARQTDPALGVRIFHDESRYTMARLAGLGGNLLAGAAVVVAVVLLFMGWRAALVVGAALPLSAGATLFGLSLLGQPLHQMTIFGMIVAIGLLIDNAIVMTDEVRRERRGGHAALAAVDRAVRRLALPLTASTLTTVLGFMPILLLPGNTGDFVGPIAVAVILALVASLAIALTVIPALAAGFAAPTAGGGWWRDGVAGRPVVAAYSGLLRAGLRWPWLAVLAVMALCLAGFGAASRLDQAFFPPSDRNQFQVEVWLPGDASIGRTAGLVRRIDGELRGEPGLASTGWMVGRSAPAVYYNLIPDRANEPGYAQGIVVTDTPADAARLVPALQARLDRRYPEARIVVRAFGQGPPVEAPLGLRVSGPQPETLSRLGAELRRLLHETPGVTHTAASITGGDPALVFQADEAAVQRAGLTLAGLAGELQSALEGRAGGLILEGLEALPVRVRVADTRRTSTDGIASLPLAAPAAEGGVPLGALGDFRLEPRFAAITRRDGERVNEIHGFVAPGTLPIEAMREFRQRLDASAVTLPPGYRLTVAGDSAQQTEAVSDLATYAPVLGALMLATLILAFRSLALAALIGLVGGLSVGLGLLALWLGGYPLGFNPIIGSAGLIGLAVNGTIVILAALEANPAARTGDPAAIAAETVGAGRHILATTLTTLGGFLPLLVFTGGDFWPPLAVVIAGGVGLAVLLSLVLTPAAYRLMARRHRREIPS